MHLDTALLYWSLGGRAYSNAHFGTGSGPIFLDDVQCTSSSSQLLECPSRSILSHNCLHSADAGVGCEGMLCNAMIFKVQKATTSFFTCSSMCRWSNTTGRRQHCKWGQGGNLHGQPVGYCVWWLLGKYWCYCCVSTVGILHSRLEQWYNKVC